MVKVIRVPLQKGKTKRSPALTRKRMRSTPGGSFVIVRTVNADSKTFGKDLSYVFEKNVAKARRENKSLSLAILAVDSAGKFKAYKTKKKVKKITIRNKSRGSLSRAVGKD